MKRYELINCIEIEQNCLRECEHGALVKYADVQFEIARMRDAARWFANNAPGTSVPDWVDIAVNDFWEAESARNAALEEAAKACEAMPHSRLDRSLDHADYAAVIRQLKGRQLKGRQT